MPTLSHIERCVDTKSNINCFLLGRVAIHKSSNCFWTHWAGILVNSIEDLVMAQLGQSNKPGDDAVPKASRSSTKYLLQNLKTCNFKSSLCTWMCL